MKLDAAMAVAAVTPMEKAPVLDSSTLVRVTAHPGAAAMSILKPPCFGGCFYISAVVSDPMYSNE
jgi:hypothetical protein